MPSRPSAGAADRPLQVSLEAPALGTASGPPELCPGCSTPPHNCAQGDPFVQPLSGLDPCLHSGRGLLHGSVAANMAGAVG